MDFDGLHPSVRCDALTEGFGVLRGDLPALADDACAVDGLHPSLGCDALTGLSRMDE
jgi:hypothetical protein